ncbi:hypothetical protein BD779DRAFT_1566722 [Infundibulicybe gibba]|nr:hypothetical protein BD779DRAFT_1566722 [Infundibulicybe gibba]
MADISMFQSILPMSSRRKMPPRIPMPSHRHGSPSGPWPFLDLDTEVDPDQLENGGPAVPTMTCKHTDPRRCNGCWSQYPQSLFPNWTPSQQRKSRISKVVERPPTDPCTVYYVDVLENGTFAGAKNETITNETKDAFWQVMHRPRSEGTRVRGIFIENLSGLVLQMFGTKYNIEPFFFSSSLGWIPSRYQENVQPLEGDHITITLTFIRTMTNPTTVPPSLSSSYAGSDRIILPDLLALHMVRSASGSTIISFHPSPEHRTTSAKTLHTRVRSAGQSVYWHHNFSATADPTFVLLCILWYALYAWDESLEVLYAHICWLESRVITTNDMHLTQELHVVRAHLLHYASLLQDLRKSVAFVLETPYPALDNPSLFSPEEKAWSLELMKKECGNLMNEIERSVNLEDSKRMQALTEAAVRDSAAMKQISYLTMVFLPASFVAAVFGMNIEEINPGSLGTLPHYFEAAIPMTAVTIWIIMAFQYTKPRQRDDDESGGGYGTNKGDEQRMGFWARFWWPATLIADLFERREGRRGARPAA